MKSEDEEMKGEKERMKGVFVLARHTRQNNLSLNPQHLPLSLPLRRTILFRDHV
jgi:hypothetical protein